MYDDRAFTDRTRKVLRLAEANARRTGHGLVEPEHILLGLVEEGEGVGAFVLEKHADLEVCAEVIRRLPTPVESLPPGALPFSPSGNRVVERARAEARELNHDNVGTEHLLLALIGDANAAVQAFLSGTVGVGLDRVRQEVLEVLSWGLE
jgi:ATP-dependent Clp protease ATP-binding subunit ClpC